MRGAEDGLQLEASCGFQSARATHPAYPGTSGRNAVDLRYVSIKEQNMQKEYRPILVTLVDQPLSGAHLRLE